MPNGGMNGTVRLPIAIVMMLATALGTGGVAWGTLMQRVPDNAGERLATVEAKIASTNGYVMDLRAQVVVIRDDVKRIERLLRRTRYGGSSGWGPEE